VEDKNSSGLADMTRREFTWRTLKFGAAAALGLMLPSCSKSPKYIPVIGYDPYVEDNEILLIPFSGRRQIASVSIDDMIFTRKSGARIENFDAIKMLLDINGMGYGYGEMRFEHPIKVGDKIQVISWHRIYEFIPNDPKSLKPITPEGEYWGDQWKTLQGHIVREGGKPVNNSSIMFYIFKDGKWKSITGVYNLSLTFSPDGKKAYSAGKKIFEYDMVENDDNITMKEIRTKNKIRDEFDDIREVKAIPDGYVFICRVKDHDWEIWRTDLNWTQAVCIDRSPGAKLDLRTSKDYMAYEVLHSGRNRVNVTPLKK